MAKRLLFVVPDYHVAFMYRDELRRLGWKTNIFVPNHYPADLLYSSHDTLRVPCKFGSYRIPQLLIRLLEYLYLILMIPRHDYFFFHATFNASVHVEKKIGLHKLFGDSFRIHLSIMKVLRRRILLSFDGCRGQETKEKFSLLDDGNVCGNCGWGEHFCNDKKNKEQFDVFRRYADFAQGDGSLDSTQYKATHYKHKSLDLVLWSPGLVVPSRFQLPKTGKLRILHSFYDRSRNVDGKNIKGSPYVAAAIERLIDEGYRVEYMYITDTPSKHMRFYQVQADIVVEQLIYGWWGSTGVETMALGKPVVCYLRPAWKEFFLKQFPEYKSLPIIEADTQNIYEVLKKLVVDKEYRERMGGESRDFAEQHFDVKQNAPALADILEKL